MILIFQMPLFALVAKKSVSGYIVGKKKGFTTDLLELCKLSFPLS